MNAKKILAIALATNLVFLVLYFSITSLSAAEGKQSQGDVRKEAAQDPRLQLESLKHREDLLRIRQRELQALEMRIDEKIRRLTELEAGVKVEIAAYRQLSNERIKHLVKIYSSMKPNAAVNLMNQLDTEAASEVFLGLKGEVAGGILSYMEPQKAAAITRRLMSSRSRQAPAAPAAAPAE